MIINDLVILFHDEESGIIVVNFQYDVDHELYRDGNEPFITDLKLYTVVCNVYAIKYYIGVLVIMVRIVHSGYDII